MRSSGRREGAVCVARSAIGFLCLWHLRGFVAGCKCPTPTLLCWDTCCLATRLLRVALPAYLTNATKFSRQWCCKKSSTPRSCLGVFCATFAGYMGQPWHRVKEILKKHIHTVDLLIEQGQLTSLDDVTHELFGPRPQERSSGSL